MPEGGADRRGWWPSPACPVWSPWTSTTVSTLPHLPTCATRPIKQSSILFLLGGYWVARWHFTWPAEPRHQSTRGRLGGSLPACPLPPPALHQRPRRGLRRGHGLAPSPLAVHLSGVARAWRSPSGTPRASPPSGSALDLHCPDPTTQLLTGPWAAWRTLQQQALCGAGLQPRAGWEAAGGRLCTPFHT